MAHPFFFFGGDSAGNDGGSSRRSWRRALSLEKASPSVGGVDAVLVERLRAGEDAAFLQIWHAHAARLADVAYRYLRSRDAAADVVQQTFIALWEGRATLIVHTSLASYLYGAVRNRATNALAHERVVRLHQARTLAERDSGRDAVLNAGELAVDVAELEASVRHILNGLPARTREIFLMSREDGLSSADIASVLGLSLQTVYNQLSRAVRALARGLEQDL